MRELAKTIAKYRTAAIVGAVFLLLFIGGSVARCVSVNILPASPEPAVSDTLTEVLTPQAQAQSTLSDGDRAIQAAYGNAERELIALLQSGIWTVADNTQSLSFTDDTLTESGTKSQPTYAYVISAVSTDKIDGFEADTERIWASISVEGKTYIITLERVVPKAATGKAPVLNWQITSDLFKCAKTYTFSVNAAKVEVVAIPDAAVALMGGDAETVREAVAYHCASFYPTISKINCTGIAKIDYNTQLVSLAFKLDNSAKTPLLCTYDLKDKTFKVTGGTL